MINDKDSKTQAIKSFFYYYVGDIKATLNDMNKETLSEYLDNDIFIGCASATSGIPECDFHEWAVKNHGNLMQ